MDVANNHRNKLDRSQSKLTDIKNNVRRAYDYFKPNYDRYNEFKRFVFEASLSDDDITLLAATNRPQLEFNILEAYISRLLGEFSKQEPDIEVNAEDEQAADFPVVKLVEGHIRHTLCDAKNHHTKYEVYKDLLSGGFSGLKVTTGYSNPMSFKQDINIDRVFDPTLCGYDQLARYSHKGDGRFCFELFPMAKADFEEENPDIDISTISYRRDFGGFNWSYLNDATQIIIVADYYEKKKRLTKIVQVRDGRVMKLRDYEKMLATWGDLAAPPAIIGKPRVTNLETIDRYRCIENQVLEYKETDFAKLPLIFVDGNSVMVKTPKDGNVRQVTRPYVYHAKGAQRLKNYAGIALANEIENTVQHKFMVAKEALPKEEDFLEAYKDVQKASVVVFNSVHESNPEMPISNPIREIQRIPAPPEMAQAFSGADSLIQNILGSYDASLGINNNQLSGVALVEAATQSNAAAMPYIVGYLQGYQRAAEIYVDLMPKYFTTPRTIPIMDTDGQKNYVKINQDNNKQDLDYDTNALNVIVKAGASFQVQKSRTIMMVKEMMGMSPLFAQFIAEKGLPFVLDNMEGKGIEQLKAMVDSWLQQMEKQKQDAQQMQQQAMMNNPAVLKNQIDQQKLQLDAQKMQMENVKSQQQFMLDSAQLQTTQQKILADLQKSQDSNAVGLVKAQTERFAKQVDLQLKHKDLTHRHLKESIETHHLVHPLKEERSETL